MTVICIQLFKGGFKNARYYELKMVRGSSLIN